MTDGKWFSFGAAMALMLALMAGSASADPINIVPYGDVGPNTVTFQDVAPVPFPGLLFNGTLVSYGVSFSERFAGQTLSYNGNNDVLSGTPTNPLTLQAGAAGQNLAVGDDGHTRQLFPYGPLGYPEAHGYGEGSFAVLFPGCVSEFAVELDWGEEDSATHFQFFRANGSLIAAVSVVGPGGHGFAREGGLQDIAGVSVHTDDPGGLGYDNIRYDNTGPSATEPTTWGQIKRLMR